MNTFKFGRLSGSALVLVLLLGNAQLEAQEAHQSDLAPTPTNYIVQAQDIVSAVQAVKEVGGKVATEFKIIRSINAMLTKEQAIKLQSAPGIKIYQDRQVSSSIGVAPMQTQSHRPGATH